jgi:glucose-1-phosphate adenylyltransferase
MENARVDPRTVVSIILGGGAGTRLFPLTKRRAKPAVRTFTVTPAPLIIV